MSDLQDQPPGDHIAPVRIEDELRQSYLDYAMSVIVGRALPDVRDGLKPVHRRVLFAMSDLNNTFNRAYMKSARIVGDVIGKYHPHGDNAAYDTIVRMAQAFSLRYPLIDGQGNFGSLDGDRAAAMRYTEIRMARITQEMLADIDQETVDFTENYDGTLSMPLVLPARIPNLLVNGSSGIAVGMATNIPPHNLREIIDGCLALLADPAIGIDDLMEHVKGPDFPTGAIVNGRAGILQAYRTGRGSIQVRARAIIEPIEKSDRERIVVTEIPYQLNRARLIERIAELVKEKKLEGITELRDESAKDTRVVLELRRGENAEVILNNLYTNTPLQSGFGINMVALVDGRPRLLNLKQLMEHFLLHRREVVTRRTIYLLRRARERGHLLEGQAVALANIDRVIELIRNSPTPQEARDALMAQGWRSDVVQAMLARAGADACRPTDLPEQYGLDANGDYHLSPEQAQAILDMRLNRLTGLERDKLLEEYRQLVDDIAALQAILGDPAVLLATIRQELTEIRDTYGDERRTEIIGTQQDLLEEDLIPEQDMVVTISRMGYAKTQPVDGYQAQRRGGKGRAATAVKEEDSVEHLLVASSHDTLLCFSNRGKVYWLRVFHIPVASSAARGRPIVNLLPFEEGERITAMLRVRDYTQGRFVFMATRDGTVKKTPLLEFSRPRSAGLIAIELEEGDSLVGVAITDGSREVMLFSSAGKAVRFREHNVRPMGRASRGVRGIRLRPGEAVIALIVPAGGQILLASRYGYGKRTAVEEFPITERGGQGVIAIQVSERNGAPVGALEVFEGDEVLLISDQGVLVRFRAGEARVLGRNTQGVRLISLPAGGSLVGLERVEEPGDGVETGWPSDAGAGQAGTASSAESDPEADQVLDPEPDPDPDAEAESGDEPPEAFDQEPADDD